MHQKWKEMTGEFSKKSKTNTEKTYEKYGKISYVFGKTPTFFKKSPTFFWNVGDIIPNQKSVT